MDRSRQASSTLDELRHIQSEARQSTSLDELRRCFDRLQTLRRAHGDDFDFQLVIAEVQEEIIGRGRMLREGMAEPAAAAPPPPAPEPPVELPPDVEKLDSKTWQKAIYLALFFTVIIAAAFFYLVQTARKLNFAQDDAARQQAPATNPANGAPVEKTTETTPPPVSTNPTVRLYTDLIPGTVTVDGGAPQDLKDGELVLDNLSPGQHSLKVTGRTGNAAFSFDIAEKLAPKVIGLPTTSNAMAVLVSAQDGEGRLVTNAENAQVEIDNKPAGDVGSDGLALESLGKTDHDLEVTEGKDKQRFVLTYTAAPALTVYVKSDPNAGAAVVITGQDGVSVFINDLPYGRKTDHGQVRVPLKVGDYTIRVHKAGFLDPSPQTVSVKKAEEAPVEFHLQPAPEIATLDIKGAVPGTAVYIDNELATTVAGDGLAHITTVKPGDHTVELRRDGFAPKRFQRTFRPGDVALLAGSDVLLDKATVEAKTAPPPPAPSPALPAAASTTPNPGNPAPASASGMEIPGEQVRRGNGVAFVPYHTPHVPGRYSFQAQTRVGGFFKHGKLQWYAGYQDSQNYVLFSLDGKHATVREVRDGKTTEVSRVPFNVESDEWVQVDLAVKNKSIDARVKTPSGPWTDLGGVTGADRDLTQGRVGLYIPGNDEVAVSDFRFSNH